MFKEVLERVRKRAKNEGVGGLLKDLSEELRSDAVPPALREAAEAVANLLAGHGQASGDAANGTVVINISVAVAVGAPGKPDDKSKTEGSPPNEALVVATAVTAAPALRQPPTHSANSPGEHGAPQGELDVTAVVPSATT